MKVSRGCARLADYKALISALGTTLSLVCVNAPSVSAETLKVFAAASLTDTLDEVLAVCSSKTDLKATGIYAGSGTLARQIEQGAPAAIYISANPEWMDWLQKRGRIIEEQRVDLIGNSLVLVQSKSLELDRKSEGTLPDLPAILKGRRIAIANPDSVPAGRYAKQAFETHGWWDKPEVQNALVSGANVREALSWVAKGDVAFGIVYHTDLLKDSRVEALWTFVADAHDPIRYPAAVIADNDSPNARRLLACLKSKEASDVFIEFGFSVLTP